MLKKRIFAAIWCIVFIIPLATMIILNSFETPDLYYSFENSFENMLTADTELVSYGNMAFVDNAPKGKALHLQDGFLNVEGSNKFRIKDSFTFSCWIKFNSLDAKEPMILSRASSVGNPYSGPFSVFFSEDYTSLNCTLSFKMKDGSVKTHTFENRNVFKPQRLMHRWHHVAVVFDKTYLCFYIDGELSSTMVLPDEFIQYKTISNTNRYFSVGRCIGTNMNAYLDEMYFYIYALDYDKMTALYSSAKPQTQKEILFTSDLDTMRIGTETYTLPAKTVYDEETGEFMVPAKAVLAQIGSTFSWDEQDRMGRADIKLGTTSLSLWAYDTHALLNANYYKLKTYPTINDNILFIPASIFADAFGADVEFKEAISQLSIIY